MGLNLSGGAKIDCRQRKQNVYTLNGQLKNTLRTRGPFFELPKGVIGVMFPKSKFKEIGGISFDLFKRG